MKKDDKTNAGRLGSNQPENATPGNRGYKRPPVEEPPPRKPGKAEPAPMMPFRNDESFDDLDPFSDLRPQETKKGKAPKPPKEPKAAKAAKTPKPARKVPASTYDFKPDSQRKGLSTYDWISILFLLLTVGMVAIGLTIYFNPYSRWNPLPPPTPLPLVVTATAMAAQEQVPVIVPTATFTPLPPDMLTQLAPAVDATAETTQ